MSQQPGSHSHRASCPDSGRRNCLFYRLIKSSIIQDKKLNIPVKFVRKFGHELSAVATLAGPSGRGWLVEMRKAGHNLWFHDGWHEFVEHHSIRAGYLLIFRYEGNSHFYVHMLNLTAYESSDSNGSHGKEVTEDNSIEILGSEGPSHVKHYPVSKGKERKDDDSIEILGSCSPRQTPMGNKASDEFVDQPELSESYHAYKNLMHRLDRENMHIAKDAGKLKSTFRSTRDIGIQFNGSELTGTADEVGLGYLDEAEKRNKRRKGSTEPYEHESSAQLNGEVETPSRKFSSKIFAQKGRAITAKERGRVIHAAEMFKTDNPFCRVVLRLSYVHRGYLLHIPSSFARKYLNKVSGTITLQVSGRKEWPVRCIYVGRGAKLSQGWTEFVWDNKLEEGDVCVFELINVKDVVLKVTIFRVLEDVVLKNQSLE